LRFTHFDAGDGKGVPGGATVKTNHALSVTFGVCQLYCQVSLLAE
jgi:hypothetical protein